MHTELELLFERVPQLSPLAKEIEQASQLLVQSIQAGGKILVCGNGESNSDAENIVGELMKSFSRPRPLDKALKDQLVKTDLSMGSVLAKHLQGSIEAINLGSHPAFSSAFNNEVDPALVFAQQVAAYGKEGDLLIVICTNGNTKNVNYAAVTALAKKMKVLALTGESGGSLATHSNLCLKVPQRDSTLVQELQLPLYHTLCKMAELEIFG
jgi:D-sedoheptulose 7-phosphate isomerase